MICMQCTFIDSGTYVFFLDRKSHFKISVGKLLWVCLQKLWHLTGFKWSSVIGWAVSTGSWRPPHGFYDGGAGGIAGLVVAALSSSTWRIYTGHRAGSNGAAAHPEPRNKFQLWRVLGKYAGAARYTLRGADVRVSRPLSAQIHTLSPEQVRTVLVVNVPFKCDINLTSPVVQSSRFILPFLHPPPLIPCLSIGHLLR